MISIMHTSVLALFFLFLRLLHRGMRQYLKTENMCDFLANKANGLSDFNINTIHRHNLCLMLKLTKLMGYQTSRWIQLIQDVSVMPKLPKLMGYQTSGWIQLIQDVADNQATKANRLSDFRAAGKWIMRPSGQSTINLFSVYQSTVNVNPHSSFVLYNMLVISCEHEHVTSIQI